MVTELTELDMMRYGDDERAEQLRQWFVWRQAVVTDELERYRYLPDQDGMCPGDLQLCGDLYCGTPEQCEERICEVGKLYCETTRDCIDLQYDRCPSCDEATPFYCRGTNACMADTTLCAEACLQEPNQLWCEAYSRCQWFEEFCPGGDGDGDTDGGIEPFPL